MRFLLFVNSRSTLHSRRPSTTTSPPRRSTTINHHHDGRRLDRLNYSTDFPVATVRQPLFRVLSSIFRMKRIQDSNINKKISRRDANSTIAFGSLKKEITSPERWMDIKHCLYQETELCSDFQHKYANDSPNQFFARHFPLIQSGCCKPPEECKMNFSSPTVWIETGNGTYSNADCYKWDNDPKKLCYNCEVCKHNFSQDVKKTWSISSSITVPACLMLVLVFTFLVLSNRRGSYAELV